MAGELDKTDFKILKLLQENGRMTNLLLSQEIKLSPAPTLERVRKLETSGLLEELSCAWWMKKTLGLGIKTLFRFNWISTKTTLFRIFLDEVNQIKEITECHHVTGRADFLLKVYVNDIKAYEHD